MENLNITKEGQPEQKIKIQSITSLLYYIMRELCVEIQTLTENYPSDSINHTNLVALSF